MEEVNYSDIVEYLKYLKTAFKASMPFSIQIYGDGSWIIRMYQHKVIASGKTPGELIERIVTMKKKEG
jgi:hypothetical protein